MADCKSDQHHKNIILCVVPIDIQNDSGIKLNSTYEEIKNAIIKHCDDSQDKKLKKLLEKQSLGDQKPSTVLRKLQELGQGNESLVRLRFLEILPENVRLVLGKFKNDDLNTLAESADDMMELMPGNIVNAVSHAPTPPNTTEPLVSLVEKLSGHIEKQNQQMNELQKAIHAIRFEEPRQENPGGGRNFQNRSRSRSRTPGPSRGRGQPRRFNENGSWCYYHFHYGKNAKACRAPCNWRDNSKTRSDSSNSPSPVRPKK